ncbi:MAG: Na+/H+ antiporter subunit E [Firmicutes bacterium]|nr:Na+/H+ antiporter subunit E [Bacillota bacterium]
MKQFLLNVFLALLWTFFHPSFTAMDFFTGFVLGAVLIALLCPLLHQGRFYGLRVLYALQLLAAFAAAAVKSGFQVLSRILRPGSPVRPAIVKMEIDLHTPEQITALANMITLTPGTLTVEVAEDRSALYIHTLYLQDADKLCQSIRRTLESRIKKVIQ